VLDSDTWRNIPAFFAGGMRGMFKVRSTHSFFVAVVRGVTVRPARFVAWAAQLHV